MCVSDIDISTISRLDYLTVSTMCSFSPFYDSIRAWHDLYSRLTAVMSKRLYARELYNASMFTF